MFSQRKARFSLTSVNAVVGGLNVARPGMSRLGMAWRGAATQDKDYPRTNSEVTELETWLLEIEVMRCTKLFAN